MYVRAISEKSHWARLYSIGGHVFAAVFWSKLPRVGIPGEKFNLHEGTQISLKIHQDTLFPPEIKVDGMVIADRFGLPPHRFLVLIPSKNALFFGSLQEPLVGPELRPAKQPPKLPVELSIQASEITYAYEIDAIQKIMTAEACSRWRPLMLFNGIELPHIDPFDGVPQDIERQAFEKLMNAISWTHRQKKVINNLKRIPGGALLVQAPGGCGKTTLLVHITQYAVDCKHYIVITGPTNSTVDDIIMKLPEELGAIRVYASSQERLHEFSADTAGPNMDMDQIWILTMKATWFSRLVTRL
ncbi:hypothetical protein BDV97DRAFT_32560 [Delphinella strobiligena]|nr:hypothetical protein BDV97DRAFT_32560 [Delphinella strobiligena]